MGLHAETLRRNKLRQKLELASQQTYDEKVASADRIISDVWNGANE